MGDGLMYNPEMDCPQGGTTQYTLLMEEILHHLGCKKTLANHGIDYQPQLVEV